MEYTEFVLPSFSGFRPMAADARWQAVSDGKKLPTVLFLHGFKGFKDWGTFDLVSRKFAEKGFLFVKMNESHNGVTPQHPIDFVDLDAFGQNNITKTQQDLNTFIGYLLGNTCPLPIDEKRFFLMGHSRGGGMVLLKSVRDKRIKKTAVWGCIDSFEHVFQATQLDEWKKNGVVYFPNARTSQQMPIYWQAYTDYHQHQDEYNLPEVAKKIGIPVFMAHGTQDPTIPIEKAMQLAKAIPNVQTEVVEGGDHTFGSSHPYTKNELPIDLERVIDKTVSFFQHS